MTDEQNRDWDKHDWAGEEHPADEHSSPRWDDKEYAGEDPDKPEEEHGTGGSLSGGGHGSGEQHWAPDKE